MSHNYELLVSTRSFLIKARQDYVLLWVEIPHLWYLPTVDEGLKV